MTKPKGVFKKRQKRFMGDHRRPVQRERAEVPGPPTPKALKIRHQTHNDVSSSPENRILRSVIRMSENESKQLNKHKKGDTMNERLSPKPNTKRQQTKSTSPTSLEIHTSDSYTNHNEGGKYVNTTEPEVVCPPLGNLNYSDWKNTKTICATDVSDSELDETRSTGQYCEALGASEEDEDVLKAKILRVIGCSDDVELRSESRNSEAVKPVNPTVECDDSSTLRLLRRYSSWSCQTDEQSLGGPGHSKVPNFLCDRTYFRGVVDLTKPQAVDGSSGVKRRPICRVRPAILRRRPGKDVGKKKVDEEGRYMSPSKSAEGKNRHVSDFLWDQRGSRVVDLTERQEANIIPEKIITKSFPLVMKYKPVIRVPNTPFPRGVQLSTDQTQRPIISILSSDEFEQYGIVAPPATTETDAVARVDDAASNAANQDEWKMKRYQPPTEIARSYLLVPKSLVLPCDKVLNTLKRESTEPPKMDPLIPICSYSDGESDGFPVIVNAATYTLDQLPPHAEPEGDQYECDREIKEESDDGSSPEADTSSSSPDGKRVYACQYCPAVLNTLQGHLDHSVIHPEVMKPCLLCDFSSPDAVQLLWHVNSTHHNDD